MSERQRLERVIEDATDDCISGISPRVIADYVLAAGFGALDSSAIGATAGTEVPQDARDLLAEASALLRTPKAQLSDQFRREVGERIQSFLNGGRPDVIAEGHRLSRGSEPVPRSELPGFLQNAMAATDSSPAVEAAIQRAVDRAVPTVEQAHTWNIRFRRTDWGYCFAQLECKNAAVGRAEIEEYAESMLRNDANLAAIDDIYPVEDDTK